MAQTADLFVDTVRGEFVRSNLDTSIVEPPRFVQGDTFGMNIYLLKPNPGNFPLAQAGQNPYLVINNAGMSCKAALGIKDGLANSTLYTWQFNWTPETDSQARTYFTSTFPMNTAAIGTLIGSNENKETWFEIEITDNGLPWTVIQKKVTIQAEVIDSDSTLTVPTSETGLSIEQALQMFLQNKVKIIFFEDINNPGSFLAVFNQDGTLHTDPVTGTPP
jgi:hypothetical protein